MTIFSATFEMHSCPLSKTNGPSSFDDNREESVSAEMEAATRHAGDNLSLPEKLIDDENEESYGEDEICEEEIMDKNEMNSPMKGTDDHSHAVDTFYSCSDQKTEDSHHHVEGPHSRKRPSQLSFGIDRILKQEDTTSQQKHLMLGEVTSSSSENTRLQVTCDDSISHSPNLPRSLLSCSPRRASSPVSLGALRFGSVDISPVTPSFHSTFLPPEVCRVDTSRYGLNCNYF